MTSDGLEISWKTFSVWFFFVFIRERESLLPSFMSARYVAAISFSYSSFIWKGKQNVTYNTIFNKMWRNVTLIVTYKKNRTSRVY